MNSAYVYLQLYRLFDNNTPLSFDCGAVCDNLCCRGDDCGMYLFPGEKKVFDLLKPDWCSIEKSDFLYENNGKKKYVDIIFCNGHCDRYQRPLACRIFPLTPYLDTQGKLSIITDPRARSVCPLSKTMEVSDYEPKFVKNVERTFKVLCKNKEFYDFMKAYSRELDNYLRFF